MRSIIILLAFVLAARPCQAQSTGDLIQQLVLDFQKLQDMKATLQEMYKGYEILDRGYTSIKDLTRGQFNLHKAFLDGLLAVSPSVKNYYKVTAILEGEDNLVKEYKAVAGQAHGSGLFTGEELGYMDGMYTTLYDRSLQSLDELTMTLTDGELRMSDAQRLDAIDRVYRDISGQLRAVRTLNNELSVQILQRGSAINDIQTLKRLYGNP
jgi:hypothetical protein